MEKRNSVSNYIEYVKSKRTINRENTQNYDYNNCYNEIIKLIEVDTSSSKNSAKLLINKLKNTDYYLKYGDQDLDCLMAKV